MTAEGSVLLALDLLGTFAFALNGALTALPGARPGGHPRRDHRRGGRHAARRPGPAGPVGAQQRALRHPRADRRHGHRRRDAARRQRSRDRGRGGGPVLPDPHGRRLLRPGRTDAPAGLRPSARRRRTALTDGRYAASQASAPTTSAWVPVSRVGWTTGAKRAEWLTGTSWATRRAASAASYTAASVPPTNQ